MSRSRLSTVQIAPEPDAPSNPVLSYQFLAVYRLRTEDVAGVMREIQRRSNTPEMWVSEDLTEAVTTLYEDL